MSVHEGFVERITGGSDGANRVAFASGIERLAQPSDMHIDGACLDVNVRAPDCIKQLLAAEDTPRMLDQVVQQLELSRTEMNVLTGTPHAMRGTVHLDIANTYNVFGEARTDPPHHRAQARKQLSH